MFMKRHESYLTVHNFLQLMVNKIAYAVLLLLTLIGFVTCPPPIFCSAFCNNNNCNAWTSSNCNSCRNNWISDGSGGCMVNVATQREFADSSDDAYGTMSVIPPINVNANCVFTDPSIAVYGAYVANQQVVLLLSGGTFLAHYKLELMFDMILIDVEESGNAKWDSSLNVVCNLTTSTTIQNLNAALGGGGLANYKSFCLSGTKTQRFYKPFYTYVHNESNTDISFTITTTNSKTSALWAVKQFILVALTCNFTCLSCFNQSSTGCTSCDPIVPYMLSGTTCSNVCLPGYGYTDDPAYCVFCDYKCLSCYGLFDNCSVCKNTTVNASYLFENLTLGYTTCVNPCQPGYFGNTTSRICELCHPNCSQCSKNSTYCQACITSYSWYNFNCFFPCQVGYFNQTINSTLNCTKCNLTCSECLNLTVCTVCTLNNPNKGFLLNSICYPQFQCPTGYFGDTNNGTGPNVCLPCSNLCPTCSGVPTPCLSCISGYYLYNGTCGNSCPTGYYADPILNLCLDCNLYCVDVTIKLYQADTIGQTIFCDMTFNKALNYSTFDPNTFQTVEIANHAISDFDVTLTPISDTLYRITIKPKGFTFLYNDSVIVTVRQTSDPSDLSKDNYPFKPSIYSKSNSLSWFLLKAPEMSDLQKQIINYMGSTNDIIAKATTGPIISQIKKSGLLAMLFSGAQITSCSIFVNSVPAQNMYEGVRFWGIFVFYDVPQWEHSSQIPNHVIAPQVHGLVKDSRMLFDMTSIYWRFHRTGQSSFFIYDVYVPMLLILICWTLALVAYLLRKSYSFKRHQSKFFTVLHKIHQATILYTTMGMLLQWLYFDAASLSRWVSLIICLLFNFYFICYQLYIYHDMIKYPQAFIGNQRYEYYLSRYGSFLKNIRYQEYDPNQEWSVKHWIRPYNYHLLSYYKKFCMIITLPLFYDNKYFSPTILMLIQLFQIVRFLATKPYYARWRNIYRFVLQLLLLFFFAVVLAESLIIDEIIKNNPDTLLSSVNVFYNLGWVGFVLVFAFNLGFVVLFFIDVANGFRKTNRQMMDQARRVFYYNKINQYEKDNDQVPLGLMNKWVKLGNLNNRNKDELPDINLRVQYYKLVRHSEYFDVDAFKIVELFMNTDFNFHKENNTAVGKKIKKKIKLSKEVSANLYALICDIFSKHTKKDTDALIIKTFVHICQRDFKAGDKVPLLPQKMMQKIQLQNFNGEKQSIKLKERLRGFPLNAHDLQSI